MGFRIPEYLKEYLDSAKYRKPFENFSNQSTYYAQVDWRWQSYMQTVVRPCIAYANSASDMWGSALSMGTGAAICKGAARLIVGDRIFYNGDDTSCTFLSDIWAPSVNFPKVLNKAVAFMMAGGTSVIKLNCDGFGRPLLSAFRIDRTMVTTNDADEVTNAVFFVGLIETNRNDNSRAYWLVEERKYNDDGNKVVIYKVFGKDGAANSPTLPSPWFRGINFENLPRPVQSELKRMGVPELNIEHNLPTKDGLGVWLLARTSVNSCVPDAPFGDPILYGCLDLLWSIDVVFSGSMVDVLNGEGKILVPKMFLQDTINKLAEQNPGVNYTVTTAELDGYKDDSFVYLMPQGFERDKQAPLPVQFDIRADQYGRMLEIYERAACVRAGFSPTSIFPYLTPDNSAKTATEVTAEENLTRASVRDTQAVIVNVINRALREVLWQEDLSTDVQMQFSDYIGNKILHDQNVRENYAAGLTPRDVAVQAVHNLTKSETDEYVEKLEAEEKKKRENELPSFTDPFGETPTFGGINDDYSTGQAVAAGSDA